MKHPILCRTVFYSAFLIMMAITATMIKLINYAPYKSSDMALAYEAGCQLASKPLDSQKVFECGFRAADFKETLDSIDEQMEAIIEARDSK